MSVIVTSGFPAAGMAESLRLQAEQCTVQLNSREDLVTLDRRLKVAYLGGLLDWDALRSSDPELRLITKLNALFLRVQEVLDMHPANFQTVIRLYPDRKAFDSDLGCRD